MLELMKQLKGIALDDQSKDIVLNHYLTKSQNAIKKYLNTDDITGLDDSIVDLAVFYYENRDSVGVTAQSQGSRSKSVIDGIPQNIKDTLPLPRIKVM